MRVRINHVGLFLNVRYIVMSCLVFFSVNVIQLCCRSVKSLNCLKQHETNVRAICTRQSGWPKHEQF